MKSKLFAAAAALTLASLSYKQHAFALTPIKPLQGNQTSKTTPLVTQIYRLGPGDLLKIGIFDFQELNSSQYVLPDGSISLPKVGTVNVNGLSLDEARGLVTSRLSTFIKNPVIDLQVATIRPMRISILGEVTRPGVYTLAQSESVATDANRARQISGFPSLTDAIQKAGGITQFANLKEIILQRRGNNPVTIDLWQLLREGESLQDLPLLDGDVITVRKVEQISPSDVVELAQSNLSPEDITVYVAGEVPKPGPVKVKANTTVSQALLAAGGPTIRADSQQVDLVRLNPDGSATKKTVQLDYSKGIDADKNPPLRNFDSIVVYPSGFTQFTDGMNRLLAPLTGTAGYIQLFRQWN